jgi:hypothetical protein
MFIRIGIQIADLICFPTDNKLNKHLSSSFIHIFTLHEYRKEARQISQLDARKGHLDGLNRWGGKRK